MDINLEKIKEEADKKANFMIYEMRAKEGNPEAQYIIGTYFLKNGNNEVKAVEWLTKAAENGYIEAQLRLALCYIDGKGVVANMDTAKLWLKKAADSGNKSAIDLLNCLNK